MADPLYELLEPHLRSSDTDSSELQALDSSITSNYISHLTTLPISSLSSNEHQSLSHNSQSILRSLQSLSKRSYKSVISATSHLEGLQSSLLNIGKSTRELRDGLPRMESEAARFAEKYSKASDNPVLDQRKKAMLLSRNVDRVSDILDLPTLLASAITTSAATQTSGSSATQAGSSYASALDLHAHIKRINSLYPDLEVISSISSQAEQEMKGMMSNLIASLQSQNLKLAAAMRTIGWLRRVAPELDEVISRQRSAGLGTSEGTFGAIFLVCRFSNLVTTLEALDPLKELADQETQRRLRDQSSQDSSARLWAGGQQTERYLKRYIEIFREQSFAMISMYKSIFPSALPVPGTTAESDANTGLLLQNLRSSHAQASNTFNMKDGLLLPTPSSLATFPAHLVDLLTTTLTEYLPNVRDRASRDSLLTQVLYCAGSLGRLGGDFSMALATLAEADDDSSDDETEDEWVEVMKKHRIQASRLELLASGVGTTKYAHNSVSSPTGAS